MLSEDKKTRFSIYVHIPFCAAKCRYCDFLSFSCHSKEKQKQYVKALCDEIANPKINENDLNRYKSGVVDTVFFGGGTPTLLDSESLGQTLNEIRSNYELAENAEITVESNPETVDLESLKLLSKSGFNRISFGVQAFQNRLLQRIGRIHTIETAVKAFENARSAGFENINIDLMFALPDQSFADWRYSLEKAIELKPEHISCYSLIMEENTPLSLEKDAIFPDEDTDREMFLLTKRFFAENGYEQYEISNFAKKGYECEHNIVYWTGAEYLSFGLGAHSLTGNLRTENQTDLDKYCIGDFSRVVVEELTKSDSMSEFIILGLRMTRGISRAEFSRRFGIDVYDKYGKEISELIDKGLLSDKEGIIRLTEYGVDISNQVFIMFL